MFTDEQISGKVLDHLGLVAATIDRLDLVKRIDQFLPVSQEKGAKVTMGQRVAAMILNGLGFMDSRLYMFPEFMENKPVERLLGEGLTADDLNDDALGRCLDAIHAYGTTALFSSLAFAIGAEQNLLGRSAHFDTTTLSVYGDYDQQEEEPSPDTSELTAPTTPQMTYGYSKDHRPDLKQVVLNLATTGASGFPIWFENHSGNASDKKILREAAERMQQLCRALKDTPTFLYVADSAMYESCLRDGGDLLWLSRVPERIKVAKDLLQQDDGNFCWTSVGKGYRICVIENQYAGHHQRWCIVSSEQAYYREVKTLETAIAKEAVKAEKGLWHLCCQTFGCEKDASKALADFKKSFKYHVPCVQIVPIKKHAKKGRPKKGDAPQTVCYQIQGELLKDTSTIEKMRRQKGRFILATNQLDREQLPDEQLLSEYKEQSKTESGFKFIKDNTFEVSNIFLKKPSRIAALMMVMTLCLMVYSVAQHHLRQCLEKHNETIPNPSKKTTQKPTIKRVFKLFHGVQVLTISVHDHYQQLVINLSDLLKKIVCYFGPTAMTIYSVSG